MAWPGGWGRGGLAGWRLGCLRVGSHARRLGRPPAFLGAQAPSMRAALLSFQAMLDEFAVMGGFSGLGLSSLRGPPRHGHPEEAARRRAWPQVGGWPPEEGSAAAMMAASVRRGVAVPSACGLMPPAIGEMRAVFAAPPSPRGAGSSSRPGGGGTTPCSSWATRERRPIGPISQSPRGDRF